MALKHIGRIKANQRKIVVAYRTLPGDPESCVVVTTENLEAADHDTLMTTVESNTGQNANEFAEAMFRTTLVDGSNMLARFHQTGKMVKLKTSEVEMTPDTKTVLALDELNKIIAEQKGVSIEDLAVKGPSESNVTSDTSVEESTTDVLQAPEEGVLTDEELAANYRSQADRLFKEAKALREQAEALVPTKKKSVKESA